MIEGAVQKLEHEVQDLGSKASQTFGRWLRLNAFMGVTWLSLIVCLLVLLLVGILDRLARTLIRKTGSHTFTGQEVPCLDGACS